MSLNKEICKRCYVEYGLANMKNENHTEMKFRKIFKRSERMGLVWCCMAKRYMEIEESEVPSSCVYILEQTI